LAHTGKSARCCSHLRIEVWQEFVAGPDDGLPQNSAAMTGALRG
jgi:hypothetical protein